MNTLGIWATQDTVTLWINDFGQILQTIISRIIWKMLKCKKDKELIRMKYLKLISQINTNVFQFYNHRKVAVYRSRNEYDSHVRGIR